MIIEKVNYTITKEQNGTYSARITYYENGVRKFKRNGGHVKRKNCVQSTEQMIKELENFSLDSLRFNEIAEEYKEFYRHRRKASSIKTINNIVDNHLTPYFKHSNLRQLSPSDIMKFQNEKLKKNYSGEYLKKMHAVLSAILNYGIKYYNLERNVANIVGNFEKESNKRDDYWSVEEFKVFIEPIEDLRARSIFSILFYTGMRKGEVRALLWSDLNVSRRELSVTKTNYKGVVTSPKTKAGNRVITIPSHLVELLEEYKAWYKINQLYRDDFVMFGDITTSISDSTIDRWYEKSLKLSDTRRITIHEFRHSHASDLINRVQANPYDIAQRLGHSDVHEVFNRYGHMYPNKQRSLADSL